MSNWLRISRIVLSGSLHPALTRKISRSGVRRRCGPTSERACPRRVRRSFDGDPAPVEEAPDRHPARHHPGRARCSADIIEPWVRLRL